MPPRYFLLLREFYGRFDGRRPYAATTQLRPWCFAR